MHRTRSGFTLVEISIVLVVIGLLVGGVLAGRDLIRASELRAVTTEYQQYKTAVVAFKRQYNALPGDMINATSFWGEQHATPSVCRTTTSTTQLTCNGDGAGGVGNWTGYAAYVGGGLYSDYAYELFRAWQHLANAGLIVGTFTGVTGPGDPMEGVIGTNMPASKLPSGGWTLRGLGLHTLPASSGLTPYFPAQYDLALMMGRAVAGSTAYNPIFTPEEAYGIDRKTDDGVPQSGNIMGIKNSFNSDCVPVSNDSYRVTVNAIACTLLFKTGV